MEKYEWKTVAPDENGKIKCLDCRKTFDNVYSAKTHYRRVHDIENNITCMICRKNFDFNDHLKLHMKASHMLPKKGDTNSVENLEWKIVEPDENGKIKCLNCSKLFSKMNAAKVHQYRCQMETKQESENGGFDCIHCNKNYSYKHHLKRHIEQSCLISEKSPVRLLSVSCKEQSCIIQVFKHLRAKSNIVRR